MVHTTNHDFKNTHIIWQDSSLFLKKKLTDWKNYTTYSTF